jgi:hypothetical protein
MTPTDATAGPMRLGLREDLAQFADEREALG